MAWIQATCLLEEFRDGQSAISNATQACKFIGQGNEAAAFDTLAAAYAEAGNFNQAMRYQRQALALSDSNERYRQRLMLYMKQKPYREEEQLSGGANPDQPAAGARSSP